MNMKEIESPEPQFPKYNHATTSLSCFGFISDPVSPLQYFPPKSPRTRVIKLPRFSLLVLL